ncbi:MAG: hypothetical protein M3Y40_04635 [Chloroflexota bacterium]|nr:hypothetical protein [Chloroflexota bacterium]
MSRTDSIEIIEAWLAEGPSAAPSSVVWELPAHRSVGGRAEGRSVLRFAWLALPAAAAVVTAVLLLSNVLTPEVGEDAPPAIPSPPASFGEGGRVDVVLLIANQSDRPYGSWHWTGSSGTIATAMPCHAVLTRTYRLRAPDVVRFGEVDPETEDTAYLDALPVVLDTAAMPGQPLAYRDDIVPVWTYAYRIAVSDAGGVAVEPLDAIPSVESAGPLCPMPDMSWPGGWPEMQAWLAERPELPDCGVERFEASPDSRQGNYNTEARQCLYDAYLAGEDAQFSTLTLTDDGPILEIYRTSGGTVEYVWQQLRSGVSEDIISSSCWELARPSESSIEGMDAFADETLVFVLEPLEGCR